MKKSAKNRNLKVTKLKKFNQNELIDKLSDLYDKTLTGEVHYKRGSVAVNAARAIGQHLSLQLEAKKLSQGKK